MPSNDTKCDDGHNYGHQDAAPGHGVKYSDDVQDRRQVGRGF